ncbi:hypothetical protein VLI61_001596 [Acinetobacter baumannii]|uniref:hypothetical protein n=1 Tax=Acinetobacter baumannii TaxID=470 RepID=UPI00178B3C77|nr:hypothetical protein [Acinetobacter baumannii]ELB0343816.1 hypothetical protein [Acinetobacter baumannii]EMC7950711.1 hypothetical protein [Acinetobacter baumannii]MCJ9560667.1 hypothetical protein [Acinetobacter baumannii]QOJ58415.1 hypothetical protein H0529_11660 [Acinetobacter baumannii]
MKPEQFIREFGVEKAREVVEGAPDKTATHWVFRKIPNYYSVDFQSWFHDGEWWDSDCHTEQDLIDSYGEDFVVSLSDLKRLVESLERINKCGGLYGFKTYCNGDYSQEDLQAIRDHESIYGGGE